MYRFALLLLISVSSLHGQALLPARLVPKAEQALISGIAESNGKLWAVGDHGHFFSYDGTWKQQPFLAQQFLTDIAVQGEEIWVVGHDALIAHRKNADSPWESQHLAASYESPLFRLHFKDENVGMAVGAYGLVLLTDNGGEQWQQLTVAEAEPHFYWVDSDETGAWYLAGEFGSIVKLSPSGEPLATYDAGYSSSFFGIRVLGPDVWIAYGLRGRMVFFDGKNLRRIENPRTSSLFGCLEFEDKILFYGDAGTILLYTDKHELIDLSLPYRIPILCAALDGKQIIFGTASGFVSRTLEDLLP